MSKVKKKKTRTHTIRVYNCSNQMIPLQLRPPGSDFYTSESQVRLHPLRDVLVPKTHMMMEQIINLKARRMVQVLYDSEVEETRREQREQEG